MKTNYPFLPKSNRKLKRGDFWSIKLDNKKYACGIVLDLPCSEEKTATMFFAGLLNWIGINEPNVKSLEKINLEIIEQGFAHIKTINNNGNLIIENIDLYTNNLQPKLMVNSVEYSPYSYIVRGYEKIRKSNIEDHRQLKTAGTWGYNSINLKANMKLK